MSSFLSNLSVALRSYLRYYMPTNRAVDWLCTRRDLKWAVPVSLIAMSLYLFATSVCATVVDGGGPGYLNVLAILFFWNAVKFAGLGILAPLWILIDLVHQTRGYLRGEATAADRELPNTAADHYDQRHRVFSVCWATSPRITSGACPGVATHAEVGEAISVAAERQFQIHVGWPVEVSPPVHLQHITDQIGYVVAGLGKYDLCLRVPASADGSGACR